MYSNYVVEFAKIKAIFTSASSATTTGQGISGIDIRSTASTSTGQSDYTEGRYSRWKIHSASGGGQPNVTINHSVSLAKWFKVGRAIQRYDLQAAYNATPVNQVFFHCFASCDDPNATDPFETWCNVSIDYTVTFFDPINPALSWLASVPVLYKPSREGQRVRDASDSLATQKWEVIRSTSDGRRERDSSGKDPRSVITNPRR
jgi:hypothetical protein